MKVIAKTSKSDIATVYIGDFGEGKFAEFVESVQPPLPKEKKWVLIVSTLFGCPVGCGFCDSGNYYKGKLSREEIIEQIEFLVDLYYPERRILSEKFKIQFARMGEPSYNPAVLDVLREFNNYFIAPGFIPSISTIAPEGCEKFFEELLEIKKTLYNNTFQMQFSIHNTDVEIRDKLMPVKKWSFEKMAEYGKRFYNPKGRKLTLNFAISKGNEIDPNIINEYFDPKIFLIKITPINPTLKAKINKIETSLLDGSKTNYIIERLNLNGFEVIYSLGEQEENNIGSNCGQFLTTYLNSKDKELDAYNYELVNY